MIKDSKPRSVTVSQTCQQRSSSLKRVKLKKKKNPQGISGQNSQPPEIGHWRCGRHVCKMPLVGSLCAEGMIIHFKVLPLPHVSRCIAMSLNQKALQVR